MVQDDNKGVDEIMDEIDNRNDHGFKNTVMYYMQIFDYSKGKSM